MTSPSPDSVEQLAALISALQDRVKKLEAGGVGLGSSSFEGGGITQYRGDGSGTPGTRFGSQFDGTSGAVTFTGPPPPKVSAPIGTPVTGGILWEWAGTFDPPVTFGTDNAPTPVAVPSTFTGVEVHVSTDPNLTGLLYATLKGAITSPRGGRSLFPCKPGTDYYARLMLRTSDGQVAPVSTVTGPIRSLPVPKEDLGFKLADLGGSTIFFTSGATTPTAGAFGDLWLKKTATAPDTAAIYSTYRWTPNVTAGTPGWVALANQDATTAVANAIASRGSVNGQAKQFTQPTMPAWSGPSGTALWFDSSHSNAVHQWNGTTFVPFTLGDGSFSPAALVASSVFATGTVSAALLEAILVLVNQIIAGDPNGAHAKLDSSGLHVYRVGPDGSSDEVIRLGVTDDNDFFSIVDADGVLVASIDDAGFATFAGLSVSSDPNFRGQQFIDWIKGASGIGNGQDAVPELAGAQHWYGANSGAGIGGVTSEVGLIEVPVTVTAGRAYLIFPDVAYAKAAAGSELRLRIRDGNTNSPTLSDFLIYYRQFSNSSQVGYGIMASDPGLWTPQYTGQHRLLLTAEGAAGAVNIIANASPQPDPTIFVVDLGPFKSFANTVVNRGAGGGAAPPPATQQHYVELAPSSAGSYRGDGSLRTDTSDIIQGLDTYANNGDGYGFWGFTLPSITGTVDRVDFYCYSNHWHFTGGGTAIFNLIQAGNAGPPASAFNALKLRGNWLVPGFQRAAGKTVTLPGDWNAFFRNASSPRALGISIGQAGNGDLTYYGRFNRADARLRIWYTQ